MTENISAPIDPANHKAAFDSANQMVNDCVDHIRNLKCLKDIYKQIAKDKDFNGDPDSVAITLNRHIKSIQENGYKLPIRGIFTLSSQFESTNSIDCSIAAYQNAENYWAKIRDTLSKE